MLFKVYHVLDKPIDLADRKAFFNEWKQKSVEILGEAPKKHETEKWREINDKLNTLEDELKNKYPTKKVWELDCAEAFMDIVKVFGTISICIENDEPVIYIMDVADTNEKDSE
jgi:hypothetical protein